MKTINRIVSLLCGVGIVVTASLVGPVATHRPEVFRRVYELSPVITSFLTFRPFVWYVALGTLLGATVAIGVWVANSRWVSLFSAVCVVGAICFLGFVVVSAIELEMLRDSIYSDETAIVAIPGRAGSRVIADFDRSRISYVGARDATMWVSPLDGRVGGVRPPHIAVDEARTYVSHNGGVTALNNNTGAAVWHSPGHDDGLCLSNDLILSTDCSVKESVVREVRWLVARLAKTGEETFRVSLPVKDFDPRIEEMAGLFVVQTNEEPDGVGMALLIDRNGKEVHRFDRQVVAVWAAGDDWLVLTSRDLVRLHRDGAALWELPFPYHEWVADGGVARVAGNDMVVYRYCGIRDSGVLVIGFDALRGQKKWEAHCGGLRATHSAYGQEAAVHVEKDRIVVFSWGSAGAFVEFLDSKSGRSIRRREVRSR